MHTQYNLILSLGIIKQSFSQDENHLILYAEFEVTEAWVEKLNKVFKKTIILRKKFEPLKQGLDFEKELYQQVSYTRKAIKGISYSNLIISQDRPYEGIIYGILNKNCKCNCIAVEEDVYYTVKNDLNQNNVFSTNVKNRLKTVIRKFLYPTIPSLQQDIICYGSSEYINLLCVLFPKAIRQELRNKHIQEIQKESIYSSLKFLYSASNTISNRKTVIIASDLIERYSDPDLIIQAYNAIIDKCSALDVDICMKYHPRETRKLGVKGIIELENTRPMEEILLDYGSENLCVISHMSAALFTAKKLGVQTISTVSISEHARSDVISAYQKMGIGVPSSFDSLIAMIQEFIKNE